MKKDMEITSVKTFFIVWFNCLRFKDTAFYNAMAYILLLNLIVVIYSSIHLFNELIL